MKGQVHRVFGLFAAIAVCLRIALKLLFIHPVTGFYWEDDIFPALLWVVLLLGVLMIGKSWLDSGKDYLSEPVKGSILLGLSAILLGIAVEFSSYEGAVAILQKIGGNNTRSTFLMLSVLFGCLSCLVFVVQGVYLLLGKGCLRVSVLGVPVIWLITYLISRFSAYTSLRTISDQKLFVLFLLCALFFLLEHAGVLSETVPDHLGRMVLTGYVTALMGLTLAVPQLVGAALGRYALEQVVGTADLLVVLCTSCYSLLWSLKMEFSAMELDWLPNLHGDQKDSLPPQEQG